MRLAFLSANRQQMPDAVVPLWLLSVCAACRDHHEKRFWDLCFEQEPLAYLADKLAAYQPDVVALGLRNVQSSDYLTTTGNVHLFQSVAHTIRSSCDTLLVLGGGGFSVIPVGLMELLGADFGVVGEGEGAFAQLLAAIEQGSGFEAIGGLYRRIGDEVVPPLSAPRPVKLDALPALDRSLIDSRYYSKFGIDSLQTKRGCSQSCTYCTYPTIEGRTIRRRDPDRVVEELLSMKEQHPEVRHVFFVDAAFNLPPSHAKGVCRAIIDRGIDLPWTCYVNPIGFDEELAELMAAAGCTGIEIGSDSGCDEVLARLKKGFCVADIEQVHRLARNAGLKDCHSFLLGTPGETLQQVERTLQFIVDLDPVAAILMTWVDDDEAFDPLLRQQRSLLRERIATLLERSKSAYPRWIIPSLGVNFDPRLFAYLRHRGFHGPLWQHIDRRTTAPPQEEQVRARRPQVDRSAS